MAIEGNHSSGAAYFRFAEEMDPDMVQVQVDNGKTKGLASVKVWILTNWRLVLGIIISLILLGIGIIIGHTIVNNPIRTKAQACQCVTNNTANPPKRAQLNVTQLFQDFISPDSLKEYFGQFTSGPHYAGSAGNEKLAGYITEQWKSFGFQVHSKNYTVTLSRPNLNEENEIKAFDPAHPEDFINNMVFTPNDYGRDPVAGMLPAFNQYSGFNSTLTGDPFFVNFGRLEDFKFIREFMQSKVMNVKNRIAVVRMGKIPLSRIVANCEAEGAIGVIAFPDPEIYAGNSLSTEDQLPLDGIIRDSARGTFGDPGSLFYPSLDDSVPDMESLKSMLPTIPVQVISRDEATGLLRNMRSPQAPPHFHANDSHHQWYMGPGFHDNWGFAMKIQTNLTSTTITNVIGVMKGTVEPDRYVIVGNHRDSLAFGGVDPGTGSACLMELARALGELHKKGWQPRRTIILASWDAGEDGHIGSTEWVEEHLEILHERAVAYINLDEAVSGQHTFKAIGSPLLAQVLYKATNMIDCPDKGHSNMRIYENWSMKHPISETNKEPRMDPPGITSDITPFLHLAGVPSVSLRYVFDEKVGNETLPTYPKMHSAYDTADYVMSQIDADFTIHQAVTRVAGEALLELADAPLLPVVVDDYADELLRYSDELAAQYSVDLSSLRSAAAQFDLAAHNFQQKVDKVNVSNLIDLRDINDNLMAVERAFLGHGGMTVQQQQLRHVIYGPSAGHPYNGVPFPMLANNLYIANVTGDDTEFRRHLPHMATMIRVAAKVLDDTNEL